MKTPLKIGHFALSNNVILAPMAGVTDRPFRQLCTRMGAGLVVSEMVSANPALRQNRKTQLRMNHDGEAHPRAVQIAGGTPEMMADAAQFNVDAGAELIDINMGCPAKKVCNKAAGSALLKDEKLVANILDAVVSRVTVPVTLKIRTGWDRANKNGVNIAKIAEQSGIAALSVHGRTREDRYEGYAEYDTIAAIKSSVSIPVIANGDLNTPQKARTVLDYTKADAVMLGRAAQGRPWIFNEFVHFLETGEALPSPSRERICVILLEHMRNLYAFYGEFMGVRIARKHVSWYCKTLPDALAFRRLFNAIDQAEQQLQRVKTFILEGEFA